MRSATGYSDRLVYNKSQARNLYGGNVRMKKQNLLKAEN